MASKAENAQADLLAYLNTYDELNTLLYANEHNIDHQDVIGAIRSIQSRGDVSQNTL